MRIFIARSYGTVDLATIEEAAQAVNITIEKLQERCDEIPNGELDSYYKGGDTLLLIDKR